ncbi:cytochrome P450 [Sparassis latifolia]|uniref:Cytochrome P450 n=1 Tax=Sparassis crispa TaxID=139825 RepID=A0A401GDD8_9APHY|nr:cytochrome P450 [Sparassis crispa]GBE80196.1 cytochrome P450 [Sparassis crispa]
MNSASLLAFNSATPPSSFSKVLLTANANTPSILFLALAFVLLYFCATTVYHVHFSPLAALPGPWYAAISDFWLTTHVVRLQQCRTVQTLFEKYGPVVRVGPNKVAFCDVTTMKSVYCVHKLDKSTYYKSLSTNNNDHAMTTLPNAQHAIRRKAYSPHYIPTTLSLFQTELHDSVITLIEILDCLAGETSVECLDLFRHLMVDIIGDTVFGCRPGSLEKRAMNIQDPLSTAVNDFPKRGILRSAVPTWAWNLVCRIPNVRWRQICDSDQIMAQFVGGRLYEMRAQMQAGPVGEDNDVEKMPLLQRMLQHRVFSTSEGLSDQNIISEAMGHLIAGVDTSSTTLSYLFWELSRRPDIMKQLQTELDDVMSDRKVIPDLSVLYRLPYLNAFIKEGLRLYSAAPSLLERIVPAASKIDDSFDLMGYALPPGTIVSTQAWSMHRDADVFPSPETFLPERWLPVEGIAGEEERLMRMTQHMIPFGVGSRVCGGQNLAQMVLRMTVAAVARNFNIASKVGETNERSMEIRDAFVIFPASKECRLTFTARK